MSVRSTPIPADMPGHWDKLKPIQDQYNAVRAENERFKRRAEERWRRDVEEKFVLKPDHVRLLKHLRFQLFEETDLVSIGADGKRPFGNGDWIEDVFRILGWEATFDRDGMTEESEERARRIMAELPYALNQLISGLES